MKQRKTSWIVVCVAAVVACGYYLGGWIQTDWEKVVTISGIAIPDGVAHPTVYHPTEVAYTGTIDLESDSNVQAFIAMNKLIKMGLFAEADGKVHRGSLSYSVAADSYDSHFALYGRGAGSTWEIVLSTTTRLVRFEVLVQDMAGDHPYP